MAQQAVEHCISIVRPSRMFGYTGVVGSAKFPYSRSCRHHIV